MSCKERTCRTIQTVLLARESFAFCGLMCNRMRCTWESLACMHLALPGNMPRLISYAWFWKTHSVHHDAMRHDRPVSYVPGKICHHRRSEGLRTSNKSVSNLVFGMDDTFLQEFISANTLIWTRKCRDTYTFEWMEKVHIVFGNDSVRVGEDGPSGLPSPSCIWRRISFCFSRSSISWSWAFLAFSICACICFLCEVVRATGCCSWESDPPRNSGSILALLSEDTKQKLCSHHISNYQLERATRCRVTGRIPERPSVS